MEVQRQFTRYLRDPDNAPPPPGADARRMRIYAKHFRSKLARNLRKFLPAVTSVLGEEQFQTLIDDYVRLPRQSPGGKSNLSESFLHWLDAECGSRGLPPFLSDLTDYHMKIEALFNSDARFREDGVAREGDLLSGVPVFSELAAILRYRWPVHRIGADFAPKAAPESPTYLLIYLDRRFNGGYLELNRQAVEIAVRIRDNTAGKTGAQLLADAGIDLDSAQRDGSEILQDFRERDIVIGVRTN